MEVLIVGTWYRANHYATAHRLNANQWVWANTENDAALWLDRMIERGVAIPKRIIWLCESNSPNPLTRHYIVRHK